MSSPSDAAESRAALRARARATRAALGEARRVAASRAVAASLAGHLRGRRVGLFVPVGDECAACLYWYERFGAAEHVAWPRTYGRGVMRFFGADSWPSEAGRYGIAEPAEHPARHLRATDLDVVVVPGLCFDARGHRLGYGAGYYDRFLSTLRPDALRVGVAFDAQVIDHVPNEAHDERVDLLLTEERVIDVRRARA